MQMPKDAVLLRMFFGENDRFEHRPLYEAIVMKAREMHLAGATVLRGPMGFGHSSRLHTAKILRLSFDLPIVVEIVDTEARINEFLPVLDGMLTSGLVTLEKVQVLQYGSEGLKAPPRHASGRATAAAGRARNVPSVGWQHAEFLADAAGDLGPRCRQLRAARSHRRHHLGRHGGRRSAERRVRIVFDLQLDLAGDRFTFQDGGEAAREIHGG